MTMNNSVYFAKFDSNSSAPKDEEVGEVCIANISPAERQKRLKYGIKQFVITLAILGVLMAFGVTHDVLGISNRLLSSKRQNLSKSLFARSAQIWRDRRKDRR